MILALFNDKVFVNLRGAQGLIRLREKVGHARQRACERALAFSSPNTAPSRASSTRAWRPKHNTYGPGARRHLYQDGGRFGRDLQSLLIH